MRDIKSQKAICVVFSVLIAIIFWLYIDNMSDNERDIRLYNIPVTFVGEMDTLAERGLMITSGDDTTIDLRLRGHRQVVSKINRGNISVAVDVSHILSTGTHTLEYKISYPSNVSQNSVSLVSANIYRVTIEIGELHTKIVDVRADVKGAVPDGYMMHECVVTPEYLTISGTKDAVEKVDHAEIEVTLHNATTSYSEYLGYRLMDVEGNVVNDPKLRVSDTNVRVEVPVVTLKELPLAVEFVESNGSREKDIAYDISPKTIVISGDKTTLDKLDAITVARVDLSSVMGDDTLSYEIPLPAGCINESGKDIAKVDIQFKNMQTETYECEHITFINIPEGYVPTAVTQSIDVTLRGTRSVLRDIAPQQIRIVVDLTGKSAASGSYTAKAKVYVDGAVDAGAIGTYQIGYQLKRE